MPLYISAPLPGPFRYSARVGGGKTAGGLFYWLLIGWWWVPLKWMFIGMYYLVVLAWKLAVWSVRGTVNYVRAVDDLHRQRN